MRGATAHAQASRTGTGRVVTTTRVLSFSQVAHKAPPPYSLTRDCLGTSLLGYSGSSGRWTAGGNAVNGCPVAMQFATVNLTVTNNCPLGAVSDSVTDWLTPPNWLNTVTLQWTQNGTALCFGCKDGEIVYTPYYTVTVSATVTGVGTDTIKYDSGTPVSVTFQMKQFHIGEPC
jgi:hypothetical protein